MSKQLNDFQLTANFNLKEFQCRHCGQVKISPKLVNTLQALRNLLNKPIKITSGFRCETHNKNVGGAKNSYHMQGLAADVVIGGVDYEELVDICFNLGFTGIGVYKDQGFIHLDIRPGKPVRFR
jgi:zinc D-Ala-D-Ala carboxypeptidase